MRVFLGITGASGAPYAARVLDGLVAAGAEVGLCASQAGGTVIAWELYRDRELPGADAVARLVAERGGGTTTAYAEDDWFSPYASGSARCDAYIVCPCSMATCGTIAASTSANLIHRAAAVALKEDRRLVVVPRETPLSVIHLRALLTLREAGALVAPAMPGFYGHPDTLQDAIDFVAGKVLDLVGVDSGFLRRWAE
jgi:4-hydroxy-3-polyprenylbenzoate decarboxylase